jgi:uncharacterized protein (TIGR03086 family)
MTVRVELLRRAAHYTLTAIDTVTPDLLTRPTPCTQWNLRMLLSHTCESVSAFQESLDCGRITLFPADHDKIAADPTDCLRHRLTRLVEDWTAAGDERNIAVADHRIPLSTIAATAALEIAVHGWDIVQASGRRRPIPADLAAELLRISPHLVTDDDRGRLFAPPIHTSIPGPGPELIAFLGRRPEGSSTRADGDISR